MNRESEARARTARLAEASRKVRKESMRVNAEFAEIERDPDAQHENNSGATAVGRLSKLASTPRRSGTRIRRPAK
jgi:hypothetical protein